MEFTQKQINILKRQYTAIAIAVGVSPSYARYIVMGKRNTNSKKAKEVALKAKLILDVLEN